MKKLSESVREAKEALKALEAELKSAAEKLNNCHRVERRSQERACHRKEPAGGGKTKCRENHL